MKKPGAIYKLSTWQVQRDAVLCYESAKRRDLRGMCRDCMIGQHDKCPDEDCPCVCNDSDFRFKRVPSAPASPLDNRTAHQSESGPREV
jgi:hypothetical protein